MLTELDKLFLKNLDEVVAESPDRIYGQLNNPENPNLKCSYTDSSDKPGVGCLIGEALKRTIPGIDLEGNESVAHILMRKLNFTDNVCMYARHLQMEQDRGRPWKEAMKDYSLERNKLMNNQ